MTKEAVYDQQIAPLLDQVIELAKEHRINLFMVFVLDGAVISATSLPENDTADVHGGRFVDSLAMCAAESAPGLFSAAKKAPGGGA